MLVQCVQIVLLTEQVIVSRTPLILLVPFENFEYSSSTKLDSFVVDHVQLYLVENQVPKTSQKAQVIVMHKSEYINGQPQSSGMLPSAVA